MGPPCASKIAVNHQGMDLTRPLKVSVVSGTRMLGADALEGLSHAYSLILPYIIKKKIVSTLI